MEWSNFLKIFVLRALPERLIFWIKKYHYVSSLKSFHEDDVEVIKLLVRPGAYVVDIGANVGWYTKILSELVGEEGHVYSIEPIPATFRLLSYCVKKLNLMNVVLFDYAMSEKDGTVLMEVPKSESGVKNFYQARIVQKLQMDKNLASVKVNSRMVDSLFLHTSRNISFLKCDVEGHELSVIEGAKQVIRGSKPAWLIEISTDPDQGESSSYKIIEYLKTQGYQTYWFDGRKLNMRLQGDKSINYFFLTEDHLSIIRNSGMQIGS